MQKTTPIPINANRDSGSGYRFPFGMYKGQRPGSIPTNYLRWLATQPWPSDYCRCEIMDELGNRGVFFHEMVAEIVRLRAEIDRLQKRLAETEQRQGSGDGEL